MVFSDAPGSPQVLYFEMYNEPDAGASGTYERWGMYGDQYAAMLKAVYPAVKAANPQAKVVFGGIAYDSFTDSPTPGVFVRQFLDDVLKSGGGAYFDIMNYHFYPLFGWNWTKQFPKDGPGLLEKTAAIQAVLAKYNSSKPIIITETSWHSNKGASLYGSNTLQVRLLQQLFTQAKAAGVPMVAWWPIADVGGSYQLDSGVVTNSESGPVTRKPSYYAYLVFVARTGLGPICRRDLPLFRRQGVPVQRRRTRPDYLCRLDESHGPEHLMGLADGALPRHDTHDYHQVRR